MSGADREARRARELQAWLDGELGSWQRRRVTRRLARDAPARAQAAFWGEVRTLLREEAAETPGPDLWSELAPRLARAPGVRPETAAPPAPRAGFRLPALVPWAGAALVAGAVALALTLGLPAGDAAARSGSLRWLDTGGRPAMVLQDDREATIIWVLEGVPERSTREGAGALV